MLHHFYILQDNKKYLKEDAELFVRKKICINDRYEILFFEYDILNSKDAREFAHLSVYAKEFIQVFFVDMQDITEKAQDVLLKLTEEPSKNTIFIFKFPTQSNIKETLISRAHVIKNNTENIKSDIEAFLALAPEQRLSNTQLKQLIKSKDTAKAFLFLQDILYVAQAQSPDWKIKNSDTILELIKLYNLSKQFSMFPKQVLESFALLFPQTNAKL